MRGKEVISYAAAALYFDISGTVDNVAIDKHGQEKNIKANKLH